MTEMSSFHFTFIGAGKIAYSLAPALRSAGLKIDTIVSRTLSHARDLAQRVDAEAFEDLSAVTSDNGKIIVLSVPDNEIGKIVLQLAGCGTGLAGKVFVHLSGALSSQVLLPLTECGALTASFHIMKSFPSKTRVRLEGAVAAVESPDTETAGLLCSLAETLKMRPFRIAAEKKPLYHMLGVASSNFLVANYFFLETLYRESGITEIPLHDLTGGIISATMSNIADLGAVAALSGPVERGDTGTIKRHLDALAPGQLREYYTAASMLLADAAVLKGAISEDTKNEIRMLLGK